MSDGAADLHLPDGRAVAKHAFIEACRNDPNPFVEYVLDVRQAPIHDTYVIKTFCQKRITQSALILGVRFDGDQRRVHE